MLQVQLNMLQLALHAAVGQRGVCMQIEKWCRQVVLSKATDSELGSGQRSVLVNKIGKRFCGAPNEFSFWRAALQTAMAAVAVAMAVAINATSNQLQMQLVVAFHVLLDLAYAELMDSSLDFYAFAAGSWQLLTNEPKTILPKTELTKELCVCMPSTWLHQSRAEESLLHEYIWCLCTGNYMVVTL